MARARQLRWWSEPTGDDVAYSVAAAAHATDDLTTDRQQMVVDASCMYGDVPHWAVSRRIDDTGAVSHNVIAQAVDALVAEMTQSLPRPMVVPVGGDWLDARRGKKLTRYLDAQLAILNVRDVALQWVRDAAITGLGAMHVFEEDGEARLERVWPGHLLVDDTGCVDVNPPAFYVRRPMDRERAKALYPEHAAELEVATRERARHSWTWALDPREDVIELLEAWHPPNPGQSDGRHVICTWDGVCLQDDQNWDGIGNELVFLRAVQPIVGFWGDSLVMRARSAQLELNKLLRRLQDSHHLFAVPRVFVQRGSGIPEGHWTNDVGVVIEHDGAPPTFMTPSAMPPDFYQHIERLVRWIFDEVGVSQMNGQNQMPIGVTSGVALRTVQNVQSRRFINLGRNVETGFCDIARAVLRIQSKLAKDEPSREVVYRRRGRTVRIPWRDMAIESERYVLDVFAASALPKDPASRMQALQEMLAGGRIDQDTFWALADMPDFEGIRDRMVAPIESLLERFDLMIDTGDYLPPDTYQDLARGLHLCAVTLQQAELDGVPDERLELLRDWHATASRLLGLAAEPPPPAPANDVTAPPGAAGPMAGPGVATPPMPPPAPPMPVAAGGLH